MSSKPDCCEISCSQSTARLCAVSSSFWAIVSSILGDDLGEEVRCMGRNLNAMKTWWEEDFVRRHDCWWEEDLVYMIDDSLFTGRKISGCSNTRMSESFLVLYLPSEDEWKISGCLNTGMSESILVRCLPSENEREISGCLNTRMSD